MNEDLRRNLDKSFLLFTKVIYYHTNTKKPWNKLNKKEMNSKTFRWFAPKMFFVSKSQITESQAVRHLQICPELVEDADAVLQNNEDFSKTWKRHSIWANVYEPYPLRNEEQFKIIVNCIGLRMVHMIR